MKIASKNMIAEEKDIFWTRFKWNNHPAIEYQTTTFLLKRSRCSLPVFLFQSLVGTNSWELASLDVVVTSPRFPVFDLVKGEQYRFRVRAVNKHGVSDPSEPSQPISLGTPRGEVKSRGLYFTLYFTFWEGRSSAENTFCFCWCSLLCITNHTGSYLHNDDRYGKACTEM